MTTVVYIQCHTLKNGCAWRWRQQDSSDRWYRSTKHAALHLGRFITTWSSSSLIITFHSTDRHFPNYTKVTFSEDPAQVEFAQVEMECVCVCVCACVCVCVYSRTQLNRTLVIRIANYPDQLGPSGKFVENSTKLTCLEITGYRIKYSTVFRLLVLQIRLGRKV